jgi:hypothetical protein
MRKTLLVAGIVAVFVKPLVDVLFEYVTESKFPFHYSSGVELKKAGRYR